MGGFSPSHWLIVGLIALLVFGPKRLPEIGKSIGRALREFNKARDDFMESMHSAIEPGSTPSAAPHPDSTVVRAEHPSLAAGEEDEGLPYGTDFHVAPRPASSASAAPVPAAGHDSAPHAG